MKSTFASTAALILPLLMGTGAAAQTGMAPTGANASSTTAPASTMAPAAPASTAMAPAAGTSASLSKTDKEFIMKAGQGGLAEVATAKVALQKGQSDAVKKYAQTMIDDHTPANQKLTELATSKGVTAPTEPSAAQQKMMAKLQTMDGAQFDHAYLTGQLKAHEAMLKVFERESTNGKDADLKAFADSTTPVVQKHITMAQNGKM